MVTARDIAMDADLFRRAYPGWPHPAPMTTTYPAPQGGTMATSPSTPATAPCGHPVSKVDESGECHGTDPETGEPCWGIFSELAPGGQAGAPAADAAGDR